MNTKTTKNLTKGPITLNILIFAIPLILGNLLQQMYNIADTWIVGKYLGSDALVDITGFGYMKLLQYSHKAKI